MTFIVAISLTTAMDFAALAGLLAAFVATPFFFVNWIRYWLALKRAPRAVVRFPTKTVVFFLTPIIIAVVAANVAMARSRRKVAEFLRQPGAAQFTVLVNGRRAADAGEIALALQGISRRGAVAKARMRHSHPTKRMRVEVVNASSRLFLELARDSVRPQEYWVFDPAGIITNENEIGRITTHLFDDY